jgi:hypothetical protein
VSQSTVTTNSSKTVTRGIYLQSPQPGHIRYKKPYIKGIRSVLRYRRILPIGVGKLLAFSMLKRKNPFDGEYSGPREKNFNEFVAELTFLLTTLRKM